MALSGTLQHKKTGRLARSLGVSRWSALGLVEALWDCVRTSARTGRIDADQWEDIAEYCYFDRPGHELRKLLIDTGFVDPMPGWDWIHDWHHYADNSTRTWLERRGLKFANGAQARIPKDGYGPAEGFPVETNRANVETNGRNVETNYRFVETNLPNIGPFVRASSETHSGYRPVEKSDVETNRPNVETKSHFVETPARARPEPEPEPEPEPAAARICQAQKPRLAATSPSPPLEPELADLATAMHSAMRRDYPIPDPVIVRRLVKAAGSVDAAMGVAKRLRDRRIPPESYGLFLAAATDRRAPDAKAAKCPECLGTGFVFLADLPAEALSGVWDSKQLDAWQALNRRPCACRVRAG